MVITTSSCDILLEWGIRAKYLLPRRYNLLTRLIIAMAYSSIMESALTNRGLFDILIMRSTHERTLPPCTFFFGVGDVHSAIHFPEVIHYS
jgi:hypothetical protein